MQRKVSKSNKKQANAVQNLSRKKTTKTPRVSKNRKSRSKFECKAELIELIGKANLTNGVKRFSFDEHSENQKKSALYPYYVEPNFLGWHSHFFSLSKEIQNEVFGSNEERLAEKQDSYEYWLHLDGEAQDKIIDLNADNEISDEDFERLINSDAYEIADFLVKYGYYGDEYSYKDYLEKEKERSYNDDEDNYSKSSFESVAGLYQALENLHDIRDFLLSIVSLSEHYNDISNQNDEETFYGKIQREKLGDAAFDDKKKRMLKNKVLATSISVNKDGTIHFSISELAKILQGVDITRIRLCEVCEDIFWAKRKDAFACSPKHSKVRQMRLLRKNWQEKGDLYLEARQKKANKSK